MNEYKNKIKRTKDRYLEMERVLLLGNRGKVITVIWFIIVIAFFRWVISITW